MVAPMVAREKTAQQRQHIIESIDELLYHKGFNLMSFTDIARASGVPRGNIYYYFKSKEEILAAVIEHRLDQTSRMLAQWDADLDSPQERIKRFTQIVVNEKANVAKYGCPMGSLNAELGKVQPKLKKISKTQFDIFKNWLKKQFKLLLPGQDAEMLATHLLIQMQGIASIVHVYGDDSLVDGEVDVINHWLDMLAASQ